MIKLMLLSLLILNDCSSKIINGKEQNFYEYVIINKNYNWDKNYNWEGWKYIC